MSKSIKQYKQAMDNISLSDSFTQRTEALLKEMSDAEKITVSTKKSGVRYIAMAGCIAAAACAALVFTLKPGILAEDIAVNETVTESVSSVTEVTAVSETIYIDLETDDNIYTISPAAIPDEEIVEEAPVTKAEPEIAAAIPESEADNNVTAVKTASAVAEGPSAEENAAESVPQTKHLYDIDFTSAETELTSYLNSGLKPNEPKQDGENVYQQQAAPSGLNFLILDEKAAEKTVTMIADAVYKAPVVEGREIVEVEFAIDITDTAADKKAFEINICCDKTIQVIVYGQDNSTSTFYAAADHEFIEIEKYLFLKFGSNAQYEDFITAQN